ncbi:MAG: MFS transporter [Acidimicrobiia bacterium]
MSGRARQTTSTFASLSSSNFRKYFIGQAASIFGTWTQIIAMAWLVLEITGSGTDVGLVTGVQFVPVLFFSGISGVIVDRMDNRKVVLGTQALLTVQATVLAIIVIAGWATVPVLCVLAFVQGIGNTFDPPSRQAFLSELVPVETLSNAVSLNAAVFQIGRILGPAVAGFVIKAFNVETCFVINALSYVVMIGVVLSMDRSQMTPRRRSAHAKGQFVAGLKYIWRTPSIRALMLMALFIGTFASQSNVVTPLFAKGIFDGDSGTLGLLSSAQGAGALVGALILASIGEPTNRRIFVASVGFTISLLLSAAVPNLRSAVVVMALLGCWNLLTNVSLNTANQVSSAPEMRGRVVSMYFMMSQGSNVVGGPVIGAVCEHWNARAGFVVGAVAAAIGAVAWLSRIVGNFRTPIRLTVAENIA